MFKITSINAKLVILISVILVGTVATILFSMERILVRFQKKAVEQALQRTELLVNALIASKLSELKVQSRLVGELPILNTVVEHGDINTITDAGRTYRENLEVPIFDILGRDGNLIASIGEGASPHDTLVTAFSQRILREGSLGSVLLRGGKLAIMAGAPIGTSEDASGVLLLGRNLDSSFAAEIRDFTKSEILFLHEGKVRGSSAPQREYAGLESFFPKLHGLHSGKGRAGYMEKGSYAIKSSEMVDADGNEMGEVVILMSLIEQRRILSTLKYSLLGIALLVFLSAWALSLRFSSGFTRPIADAIRFAQKLASGDRSTPIEVNRSDELGALQDSLEKMRIALQGLIENLDAKVREAIKHVTNILNNLDSGFLIFDSRGIILPGYSRISEEYFGGGLAGKKLEEILGLEGSERQEAEKWRSVLFQGTLPFKDVAKLGPATLEIPPGRHIELSYRPILADKQLDGAILIATDKTAERRLLGKFELEKARVGLILKITSDPESFADFIADSRQLIGELQWQIGNETPRITEIESILRDLHTLKGNAGMYNCVQLRDAAHDLENDLADLSSRGEAEGYAGALLPGLAALRKGVEKVVEDYGALVGNLSGESEKLRRLTLSVAALAELEAVLLANCGGNPEVHEMFVNLLLLDPFIASLRKYETLAAELAERRQKRLKPILWRGESVKVKMSAYKGLAASLVHAFRNAVEHGIETPEERMDAGKDPEGQLEVVVAKAPSGPPRLLIRIRDDGKGLDPSAIRRKIADDKLYDEGKLERLGDREVMQFVFKNGFTLAESVTDVSGRGVGMDAIAWEAVKLQGKVWIESVPGSGTELFVEVPFIA